MLERCERGRGTRAGAARRPTAGPLPAVLAAGLAACAVASCGGGEEAPGAAGAPADPGPGGGDGGGGEPTYGIGGSVSGLTGSGLVISNNGSDELTIDAPGDFAFATELADGATYEVAIVAQPADPENVCVVENGTGAVAGADIENIAIDCSGPLVLVSAAPADGDQDVSRAIQPRLVFSAAVDAATASPANLALASDAGEVAVAIAASADTVTLTPAAPLLPLTEYTLAVTPDLLGADGERLPEALALNWKTRDGGWSAETAIDGATGAAADAQIAFDGAGNALALWYEDGDLVSNYYAAGVGWSGPEPLEDGTDAAADARVGFPGTGEAIAVWLQEDGPGEPWSVHSGRYLPGTGWTGVVALENDSGEVSATTLALAVSSGGDAIAVWEQFDGTRMDIRANRYLAGAGWLGATTVDDADAFVSRPHAAIDDAGNVLVVWHQSELGTVYDVVVSRPAGAADWEPPTPLSDSLVGSASQARAAFDGDGNVLVAWRQNPGFDRFAYATRQPAGGAWDSPAEIGHDAVIENLHLAADRRGNAFAVWKGSSDTPYANRYDASSGWAQDPEVLGAGPAFYPKVAFDPSGNALAVWFELDLALPIGTGYSVWGNRYTLDNGWTASERISDYGGLIGTFMPNLAVDTNGDAFAAWTRAGQVWVNRFE